MRRASFEDMNCSIARSLEIIGEWWTMLILRDCFFGVTRFEDFQQRLGIARNVLATRLDTLVDHGMLRREPYDEARGRFDYRLTDKGRAIWPVMTTLRQWGDEWVLGEGNEPIELVHTTCGSRTHAALTCSACDERLELRAVRATAGPGYASDDALLEPGADSGRATR
ncbi:winged helix-turn-helix transcriptional regulator [Actinospongicola halichondriae]|uniref:winged helix-turn-helix transcriptional regulator n=1 Tax=Actinospongicola halichondriae TaxID=3236844 RepID=UPI003D3F4BF7